MATSMQRQTLSSRCEFMRNFPVSASKSYRLASVNDPYNEQNNPGGIIDLSIAESFISAKLVDEWMTANGHFKWNSEDQLYYPFEGSEANRSKFAQFINKRFKPANEVTFENIILGHGAEGLMESLAFALADPNDCFLIMTPYYYNIDQDFTLRTGVKLWQIDTMGPTPCQSSQMLRRKLAEAYDQAIEHGCCVRGLILLNPKNPLGTMYSSKELQDFIDFCSKYGLHLIADEVYAQMVFRGDEKFTSTLSLNLRKPELVHVVYSLSKDFALSGLRIGILVSRNEPLIQTFQHSRQSLFSSVPSIIVRTAAELVADDSWLDNIYYPNVHSLMRENYGLITSYLDKLKIPYLEACAGFFVWAFIGLYILPCTFQNEEIFTNELVSKGRVCLMPGQLFHCAQPGWFRIIITHEVQTTKLAMERLEKFLKTEDANYLKYFANDRKSFTPTDELTHVNFSDGEGDVENLLLTLTDQIRTSDWLSVNTAEKWEKENGELAAEFRRLRSLQKDDNDE